MRAQTQRRIGGGASPCVAERVEGERVEKARNVHAREQVTHPVLFLGCQRHECTQHRHDESHRIVPRDASMRRRIVSAMRHRSRKAECVARAAIDYVVEGEIIGVGTGSTANFFIDELAKIKDRIKGTVASSEATASRLRGHGIPVFDLNDVESMAVYIDGADEINAQGAMIKGGGAALTPEAGATAVARARSIDEVEA